MSNDNTAPVGGYITERRKLRTWAARRPLEVQNLASVICCQLRILSRNPQSAALRYAIAQGLKRLKNC